MNYPAAEQRGICKGDETPQVAGNLPLSAGIVADSSASGGLKHVSHEWGGQVKFINIQTLFIFSGK
jgi:hypothetical protein